MYEIAIDHADRGPVYTQEEAEAAVIGQHIVVKELSAVPGNFLVELPENLIEELRRYGSFDIQDGEYYLMCQTP
jgi:hypothetical protein